MIYFQIVPVQRQCDRLMKELAHIQDGAPKAMSAALNKVALGVRADVVRAVKDRYTAKPSTWRAHIRVSQRASPRNLSIAVSGAGRAPRMIEFSVRPNKITKPRPAGGLYVEILKGKPKRLPHAFIRPYGEMKVLGVAQRVFLDYDPDTHPLNNRRSRQLYGPDMAGMMRSRAVMVPVHQRAMKRLDVEIERAMNAVLAGKLGAGRK